jgi:hypothetical protein
MLDANTVSLAVWDVPMPVVAGETFSIKVGAKSASGRAPASRRVEIVDATGLVVASAILGDAPWPGTEALYWAALEIKSPRSLGVIEYGVRCHGATTRFSVAATAKPQHKLNVKVTEQSTAAALGGVEIRLGPFHARTDAAGQAELRVCQGEYQLQLWRTAHIAQPQPIRIDGDASVALTMAHVPEEHPDARWVR